jgi:uncharacterized protein (TIGR00251 family)
MSSDPSRVEIRVVPRASRNSVDGVRNGRIVVRVTAPPVDGAATAAAVAMLAEALGVARTAIQVVSGQVSRNKVVTVGGLARTDVFARLATGRDRTTGSIAPRGGGSGRRKNR